MEELRDNALADHHAQAQRERGGHHPGALGDPLVSRPAVAALNGRRPRRARVARSEPGGDGDTAAPRDGATALLDGQLTSPMPTRQRAMTTSSASAADPASYLEAHRYD